MAPVTRVTGRAIPFGASNIDTDTIIPARWLKTIGRAGLGQGAFEVLRREPGNVFDAHPGAPILIAGENFGCGSSREHAAWALRDMGVRAVIAPSFADIFASNAFKNGIVLAALPREAIDLLLAAPEEVTVDLDTMTVTTPRQDRFPFSLDPFRRHCLMNGLDEIALTLAQAPAIAAYEQRVAAERPWTAA